MDIKKEKSKLGTGANFLFGTETGTTGTKNIFKKIQKKLNENEYFFSKYHKYTVKFAYYF